MKRCGWVPSKNKAYTDYHDKEWGVPVKSDRKLFEMLILEGAQAGLSWETILKRMKTYRKAYDNFNAKKIAKYTAKDKKRLLADEGIIRNRLKVDASIINAKLFLEVQKEFGSFYKYLLTFGKFPIQGNFKTWKKITPTTKESDAIAKDLKNRGFKFVGSTIIYAFMQAVGLVNDHELSCSRYKECKRLK